MHQVMTRPSPSSEFRPDAFSAQHARQIAGDGGLFGDHELHAGSV